MDFGDRLFNNYKKNARVYAIEIVISIFIQLLALSASGVTKLHWSIFIFFTQSQTAHDVGNI